MQRLVCLCSVLMALASSSRAEEMPYVIKVTASLVYLDVGTDRGAQPGDTYVVARQTADGYAAVGQVALVRLAEQFSIAEVLHLEEGEEIQVLQRAVPAQVWEAMTASRSEPVPELGLPARRAPNGRSVHLIGGGEWRPEDRSRGLGLGLRLGYGLARRWRLNLTARAALRSEVSHAGLEADVHLVPLGWNRFGPYVGAGGGLHLLGRDAPPGAIDTSKKVGANLMAGLQVPGALHLLLEVGYQHVLPWDDLVDVSHVRAYLGVGLAF